MLDRHLASLQRAANLHERREYMARVEVSDGANVAEAVRVAFTLSWQSRNQSRQP